MIAARNQAVAVTNNPAGGPGRGRAQRRMRELFALAESYPDLKANQNFLQLQGELSNTENQISTQRQGYNSLVVRTTPP